MIGVRKEKAVGDEIRKLRTKDRRCGQAPQAVAGTGEW